MIYDYLNNRHVDDNKLELFIIYGILLNNILNYCFICYCHNIYICSYNYLLSTDTGY